MVVTVHENGRRNDIKLRLQGELSTLVLNYTNRDNNDNGRFKFTYA